MNIKNIFNLNHLLGHLKNDYASIETSDVHYKKMKKNIASLMLLITVLPMLILAGTNYKQYKSYIQTENLNQFEALLNKTKYSFDLFLQERVSAIKYLAHTYPPDQLTNLLTLKKVFYTLQNDFTGFVDLGLVNSKGIQISYVGPYSLKGKDYAKTRSFNEGRIRGVYISDVFMGYRNFPHIVIVVANKDAEKGDWLIRTSIDLDNFNAIIASMNLGPDSDAFLINRKGIIQTPSKFFGDVLEKFPVKLERSYQPTVIKYKQKSKKNMFIGYVFFPKLNYILVVTKPESVLLKSLYGFESSLFLALVIGIMIISIIIIKISNTIVIRVKEADRKREAAFSELEHANKLTSIGRMAAGVAHEINNPMAIINEEAGLLQDIILSMNDFPEKEKFLNIAETILQTVERAKGITYRLLGFAKRLEVKFEILNINEILKEVLGFLEKDAMNRNISINLKLDDNLPMISSDQGQLEQVFLNLMTNAMAAMDDGGHMEIASWQEDENTIGTYIKDDGCGMSEETRKNIFEPFFTTKKEHGTGLGLSITYGIIQKLEGSIKVESKVDVGTKFIVLLPVKMSKIK